MLGKRARAHMRRTTSMTGITVDAENIPSTEAPAPSDQVGFPDDGHAMVGPSVHDHRLAAVLSPRFYSWDLADHRPLETSNFLRTCGLCKRRLAPGRDIYMYRGDTAFCSEECREQRMKQDERKEKYKMGVSKNVESHHNQYSELNTAASESSSNSKTVAAAL